MGDRTEGSKPTTVATVGYLIGVVFLALGAGLVLANKALAEATSRSNAAFTRGRAFTGPGWTIWNRMIYYVVGAAFVAVGVGLLLGLLDW